LVFAAGLGMGQVWRWERALALAMVHRGASPWELALVEAKEPGRARTWEWAPGQAEEPERGGESDVATRWERARALAKGSYLSLDAVAQ
jgi:hypothetical protein